MSTTLQWLLLLALAPLVQGIIRTVRARLQGRPGPVLWQSYRDLLKLWSKEAIVAENTSVIVPMTPGVALGVAVVFAAVIPPVFGASPLSARVDVIALILLLALGRFFITLAALDTRSTFAGMAVSREVTFAALTEVPLILALLGSALGHTDSLGDLHAGATGLTSLLAAGAMLLVLLSETARIPVDNQATHLELTMIHEGLVLEYSGWHLALLQFAANIRQLAFFVLAAALLPGSGFVTLAWIGAFIVAMPLIESAYARMRLFEVPQLFASAFILALAGIAIRLGGIGRLW